MPGNTCRGRGSRWAGEAGGFLGAVGRRLLGISEAWQGCWGRSADTLMGPGETVPEHPRGLLWWQGPAAGAPASQHHCTPCCLWSWQRHFLSLSVLVYRMGTGSWRRLQTTRNDGCEPGPPEPQGTCDLAWPRCCHPGLPALPTVSLLSLTPPLLPLETTRHHTRSAGRAGCCATEGARLREPRRLYVSCGLLADRRGVAP